MRAAVDTSLAVPYLSASHEAHEVASAAMPSEPILTGHSLAETYAVLTRLPGDARLAPADAALLLQESFGTPVVVPARLLRRLAHVLSALGIAGGQTYDALVALAVREAHLALYTADRRAAATYGRIGVRYELVALG